MMSESRRNTLGRFLHSSRPYPLLLAVSAGLYPMLFYFNNNFTLINTWEHVWYFVSRFLLIPAGLFLLTYLIFKLKWLRKWRDHAFAFLNIFIFLFLMKVSIYAGLLPKVTAGILVIAVVLAFALRKHIKKVAVMQLVLALVTLVMFLPKLSAQLNYSSEWMEQPDDITQTEFVKKPNVYLIQPDGYANSEELKKGHYDYDNSEFDEFLAQQAFVDYPGFRSNYPNTLTSNSATFSMKHHYFAKAGKFREAINARDMIVTDNAVLQTFRNNGYKTHLIAELPYLLLNRPKMGFDYCNFDYENIAFIDTGLEERQDILGPLDKAIGESPDQPKFFFIEIFNPGHIENSSSRSGGVAVERQNWLRDLEKCNEQLEQLVSRIRAKDPDALVILMSDHGGYVGMKYTGERRYKQTDRDLIYSIFTSLLAIHWPNDEAPPYAGDIKSPVNLFRYIFSYLSENESYLSNLQPDESYVVINIGAPKGVYQYIDDRGEITFKKR